MSTQCFLYVLLRDKRDQFKIGIAKTIERADKLSGIYGPFDREASVCVLFPTSKTAKAAEALLHSKYKQWSVDNVEASSIGGHTEWFSAFCFEEVKAEVQRLYPDRCSTYIEEQGKVKAPSDTSKYMLHIPLDLHAMLTNATYDVRPKRNLHDEIIKRLRDSFAPIA